MSFQTVFTEFGQPIDLKLVTLITGICKSRYLFMLILCGLFWLRISDYRCVSLLQGVHKARDDKSHSGRVVTKVVLKKLPQKRTVAEY